MHLERTAQLRWNVMKKYKKENGKIVNLVMWHYPGKERMQRTQLPALPPLPPQWSDYPLVGFLYGNHGNSDP